VGYAIDSPIQECGKQIPNHLDSVTLPQSQRAIEEFKSLRSAWAVGVSLQGVAITSMKNFLGDLGTGLAGPAAANGGVLGGYRYAGTGQKRNLRRTSLRCMFRPGSSP